MGMKTDLGDFENGMVVSAYVFKKNLLFYSHLDQLFTENGPKKR